MKTFARASKNNKLSQVELKMLFFISKAKKFGWCEVQRGVPKPLPDVL